MSSFGSDITYGLALDPNTAAALTNFARRRRWLLLLRAAAAGVVFLVAAMFLVACCDYLWLLSDAVRWLLSMGGYALSFAAMWWFGLRHFGSGDPRSAARQLEATDPRMREDLLSAVELADPRSVNGSEGFRQWLQHRVARRAAALNIRRLLPLALIRRWVATGALVLLVCLGLLLVPQVQFARRIARAMLPGVPIERASLTEITILHPSPPSGYVAEGDAVGVTARIAGRPVEEVWMQWRTVDGGAGESILTPRVAVPASPLDGTPDHGALGGGTLDTANVFAANLSIGSAPVEYRIIAGDAVTLWNELTPLPRPRVESFKKRYEFPSYAELPDREEEAEHGDLKALAGTLAQVTVRFDQEVSQATLRFGNRGATVALDPIDGSSREFLATIPIRTPASYQVDATAIRSGLSNPFSPQYSITPVIDAPPAVRCSSELTKKIIVSPLDVVSLAATVSDDLPMDRVVHEFQINADPVLRRNLPVAEAARELDLRWDWDLLRRMGNDEASIKLVGGDIIRMRVVGIDRHNQRGESEFVELLVAEEGFDSDRHDRLNVLGQLTSDVARWALGAVRQLDQLQSIAREGKTAEFAEAGEQAAQLRVDREQLARRVQQVVSSSQTLPEASTWELQGRAMLDLDHDLADWLASAEQVFAEANPAWQATRGKRLQELVEQAKGLSQAASRIEQQARAVFGEELTVALIGDASALQKSLRPLTDRQSKLPLERFPRYLTVAIVRLEAVDDLIAKHEAALPESTRKHLENWLRWSDSWASRLRDSVAQPPGEDAHRSLVSQFDGELRNQFQNGLVDGRLASTVINMLREVRNQIGATSDLVRANAAAGDGAAQSRQRAEQANDSEEAARQNLDAQHAQARFDRGRDLLLARLAGEETLHRSRPQVDLQYAADMKLMHRAVEHVTQQGYADYRDESAASVHQTLAKAFQIIEAAHEADQWLAEVLALMLAERQLQETAAEKLSHPTWIERFSAGLEWPVQKLTQAQLEWKEVEGIEQSRYNDDFNQARNLITQRRWSGDRPLTAEAPLDRLQQHLAAALEKLEPRVDEARDTIRRYVPLLSEQARQAAEKTRQAQQRTESRADSEAATAEQLDRQQQEAEAATRETLESLVDLANTAQLSDAPQRELARDADAAAAQIQSALERADESMQQASDAADAENRKQALNQTAEALQQLTDSLEQTAAHFERAEKGEDLEASRQALRQAEQALSAQQELHQRYDRAKAMADAAAASPQELMKQLEQELQRNEPMQQELSEISRRAAEAAQQTLEQAARNEQALNQSLERSDPTFQERKRRTAKQLATLAGRAATIDQSLLNATERAIGWANTPDSRPKLSEAREQLREAVQRSNEMGGENALLSQMQATAADMARAIESADEALQQVHRENEQAQNEDIHKDDGKRNQAKDQLERFARDAKAQQIRAADSEKRQWADTENDAGRRVSQAQRQKSDAEKAQRQVESRIQKDPKQAEPLRPQLEQLQQRAADAARAEEAAKETKTFAEQQEQAAAAKSGELKKEQVTKLDQPNPAAQLASNLTAEASNDLKQLRSDLQQLSEQSDFAEQLRSPQPEVQQFALQQRRLGQDVHDAAEELRRAARHEQRLGRETLAEQLEGAAAAVTERAETAVAEAAQTLQSASQDAQQSPQAGEQLAEATEQIRQAAEQVSQLLSANAPPQDAQPSEGEPTVGQQRGEQLAKTLDELDRSLAQSSQSQSSQSQSSQSQSEDSQGSTPPADQPQQQGPSQPSGPPTAADASPTLANAMDAQAQQAARQRNEQLHPGDGQQPPGPPSSQNAASATAANQPGGGSVDASGIDRLGSDWGQLRQRAADDAAESRAATISPQYRREIEAYFRAIAQRAAETQE